MGRPRLQYLKQVPRNTAADSYTTMKRMSCNNSRRKAANQSQDWGIRRRPRASKIYFKQKYSLSFAVLQYCNNQTFAAHLLRATALRCIVHCDPKWPAHGVTWKTLCINYEMLQVTTTITLHTPHVGVRGTSWLIALTILVSHTKIYNSKFIYIYIY